jgi:hypothetical protein
VSSSEEKRDMDSHTGRMMEAETRVSSSCAYMLRNAMDICNCEKVGKSQEGSPLRAFRDRAWLYQHFHFGPQLP